MAVVVDTSAFYAFLSKDDTEHSRAKSYWQGLLDSNEDLITTGVVLFETFALIQRRVGVTTAEAFYFDSLPLVKVEWISAEVFSSAAAELFRQRRRDLSLVDCSSFVVMRRLGIRRAFAFDRHFAEQGFEVISA